MYGLEANGFRYNDIETLRKECEFPCTLHWNFNHFVVLNGFKKNKAVINDPARGTIKISLKELDKNFTGICLQIKPSKNFSHGGTRKSTLEFTKRRLKGAFSVLLFTALTAIIASIFGAINPIMSKIFMNKFYQA